MGADPDLSIGTQRILSLAISTGTSREVIWELVKMGANPYPKNPFFGETFLQFACDEYISNFKDRSPIVLEKIQTLLVKVVANGADLKTFLHDFSEKYLSEPAFFKDYLQIQNHYREKILNTLDFLLRNGKRLSKSAKKSLQVLIKEEIILNNPAPLLSNDEPLTDIRNNDQKLIQKIPDTTAFLLNFMAEKNILKKEGILKILGLLLSNGVPLPDIWNQDPNLIQKILGTTVSLFDFMTERNLNKLATLLNNKRIKEVVLQATKDSNPQVSNLLQVQFEKAAQRGVLLSYGKIGMNEMITKMVTEVNNDEKSETKLSFPPHELLQTMINLLSDEELEAFRKKLMQHFQELIL